MERKRPLGMYNIEHASSDGGNKDRDDLIEEERLFGFCLFWIICDISAPGSLKDQG